MDAGTEIGSYRIEGLLGKGGMAEVYKAWHLNLHRHEALKVLPPQMTFDHSFVERFLHEARTAAQLHHPNIATIHAVSDDTGPQYYFAMELVEGGDLADLLEQRGSLPLDESLSILRQAARALDYAHSRGVVHRDIKPGNILLGSADGDICVKMVDFGIARAQSGASSTRLTRTGMIIGTPEYMSPEQAGSGAPVDHRTDLYSLGVVAYEMICGQPPFRAQTDTSPMSVMMAHVRDIPRPPVELVPGLPVAANNAILKALAKDPQDRFHTCGEFVDALSGAFTVSLPPVLHATAAPPYQPQPTATVPSAPHVADEGKDQTISNPKSASRAMPLLIGLAVLAGLGLVVFGIRNTGSPNPSANSNSTTGGSTTANSTATGSGGSSTIGSSSSLPPAIASGMTTSSGSTMKNFGEVHEPETTKLSTNNLKQLGTAMIAYIQDYDQVFPPMNDPAAMKAIWPFVARESEFIQPDTQQPYQPNPFLSHKKISDITSPADMVEIYESTPGPDGKRGITVVDGDVKRISELDWPQLKRESHIP